LGIDARIAAIVRICLRTRSTIPSCLFIEEVYLKVDGDSTVRLPHISKAKLRKKTCLTSMKVDPPGLIDKRAGTFLMITITGGSKKRKE
jgi:hypothetical protein